MSKLRVWWIPDVPSPIVFYVPVTSPEEAKKVLDILAAYDAFQYTNDIKGDYSNTGGLEQYDEESGEWNDWFYETKDVYYDNVDEYCEEKSEQKEEIEEFEKAIFEQIDWSKLN